jgi:site-specific recombinase XerD
MHVVSVTVKPDTPLFWSTFGQRRQGTARRPVGRQERLPALQDLWSLIGYPMLKPHDQRHGVAVQVYEQHRDLEQVRGLLGHTRIETTQLYAQIRPGALKHAMEFYEAKALDVLSR